ncbi:sodium:solute symporter family protein [candidate division KSB1 bacterium]|nr:sodium:solute symporter family protein [candidate division KSB1 bacterium]
MNFIDYLIFFLYMILLLYVGFYFYRKINTKADYYVGNRSISASHIGLSIVATDVGGGFSIGLGGLGFVMGLSGSWLLFTGLIGAWFTAVFMVPKIKKIDTKIGMYTFPDFIKYKYDDRVALGAAVISGIGYLGFTGGQILAGAKLAAGTIFNSLPWGLDPLTFSIYMMSGIILLYTVLGGLKAVIYTDTIQWIILLAGLLLFALPFSLHKIGGWNELQRQLPQEFFTLTNLKFSQFINWIVTIVPIWFIGMTLYQRIYASRNVKEARKAWFIAGVFEYPVIAFIGVSLGMMARIIFPNEDPEMGLPMLIKHSLPVGITGIVIAAYFSAIMSTADSCLIASSGNFVNDIIHRFFLKNASHKTIVRVSQIITLILGGLTIIIASSFNTVLEIILHAYSFMVAGLFIPTLGALFWRKSHSLAALVSMYTSGSLTLCFIFSKIKLPLNLDASFYGIIISFVIFVPMSIYLSKKEQREF